MVAREVVHIPHLADVEVASAVRRLAMSSVVDAETVRQCLDTWTRLACVRHGHPPLLPRVWELRASHSAYDAAYIALPESLGCPLVTADQRLAASPMHRSTVTIVPR